MPSTDKRGDLTVITHARDAAGGLSKLLPTVRWAAEVIIIDMQSSDNTAAVARAAGARVLSTRLHPRVDAIRNRYLEEARTEWILVLDADEYLADDAPALVDRLIQEKGADYDAFAIPRFNRIGTRILRGSGWYPDPQVRLFRRGCVRWTDSIHHPPDVVTGPRRLHRLTPPDCLHLHHDNYPDLSAFIERQLRYALQDVYDPDRYCSGDYLTAAYAEFARRHDPGADGDLSRALAIVMAWDKVMRGLIHWDRLDPKPSLEDFFTLPVAVKERDLERELSAARATSAALEEVIASLLNTRALRLCRLLDRVRGGFKTRRAP